MPTAQHAELQGDAAKGLNGTVARLAAQNAALRDELRRLPEELAHNTRLDLQRLESRVAALVRENKSLSAEVQRSQQSLADHETAKAAQLQQAMQQAREAALHDEPPRSNGLAATIEAAAEARIEASRGSRGWRVTVFARRSVSRSVTVDEWRGSAVDW